MITEELFSQLSLWTVNFNLKSFNFHVYIRIHIENTNTDPQSSWIRNQYGSGSTSLLVAMAYTVVKCHLHLLSYSLLHNVFQWSSSSTPLEWTHGRWRCSERRVTSPPIATSPSRWSAVWWRHTSWEEWPGRASRRTSGRVPSAIWVRLMGTYLLDFLSVFRIRRDLIFFWSGFRTSKPRSVCYLTYFTLFYPKSTYKKMILISVICFLEF